MARRGRFKPKKRMARGGITKKYEHGGSHCPPGMMYQNGGCVSMQTGGRTTTGRTPMGGSRQTMGGRGGGNRITNNGRGHSHQHTHPHTVHRTRITPTVPSQNLPPDTVGAPPTDCYCECMPAFVTTLETLYGANWSFTVQSICEHLPCQFENGQLISESATMWWGWSGPAMSTSVFQANPMINGFCDPNAAGGGEAACQSDCSLLCNSTSNNSLGWLAGTFQYSSHLCTDQNPSPNAQSPGSPSNQMNAPGAVTGTGGTGTRAVTMRGNTTGRMGTMGAQTSAGNRGGSNYRKGGMVGRRWGGGRGQTNRRGGIKK